MKFLFKERMHVFVIASNFRIVKSLLLSLFTLLPFLGFLLLNYSSRNSKAIVFLEVILVVNIASNEKLWVRGLQFIKESIVNYWQLRDIQEHELGAFLNDVTNTKVSDTITLDQLYML